MGAADWRQLRREWSLLTYSRKFIILDERDDRPAHP